MEDKPLIIQYSHGIIVRPERDMTRRAVNDFCHQLIEWEWRRPQPKLPRQRLMKRVFATARRDRTEYRFHINQIPYLLRTLGRYGICEQDIDWQYRPLPEPAKAVFPVKSHIQPTEEQEPVIEFLSRTDTPIKVCSLSTGKGKTISTILSFNRIGLRTLIQLRGRFVEQWIDEIENVLSISKRDIVVIRGRDALISAINMAYAGELQAKIVIITWKTLFNLFKDYENDGLEGTYGIEPDELYQIFAIGTKVVDEVHLDFHLNFRSEIYTNVLSSIHLSATLKTKDPFKARIYEIAFPYESFYHDPGVDPYIGVHAIQYQAINKNVFRTKEAGSDVYAHTAFEKSIRRRRKIKRKYLQLIDWSFRTYYNNVRRGRQKCLIYCAMTDFCEEVSEYLRRHYGEVLNIQTFVSGSDEQILRDADVIVSTLGSCGTGKDIPDLRTVIMTTAVNKYEANRQAIGRIRYLKNYPEDIPYFVYFYCQDIEKQRRYHDDKYWQLKDIALYHQIDKAPFKL